MKLLALLASSVVCQEKVVVGYYVPWGGVQASELSYTKVTHINYGFALLKNMDDPADISFDAGAAGFGLGDLVKGARPHGVKVLISLGGWTGSQAFSRLAASTEYRKKFVDKAMLFLQEPNGEPGPEGWGLDGIDLDWEYPGQEGAKCEGYPATFDAAADYSNYVALLRELRADMNDKFGKGKKLLTAAVRITPFAKDGVPSTNVADHAKEFDFINIMAYDMHGSWEANTGANAPFRGDDGLSYQKAIADWVSAAGSPDKIVAGLAFYGRTQTTTAAMDGTSIKVANDGKRSKGDDMDEQKANANCDEGAEFSGIFRYHKLRTAILTDKTTAGNGFTRHFDEASQTPYLFNNLTNTFISYDDVQSLAIKVKHALDAGLRGVMYWDMTYDYQDELLDVLQPFKGNSQPASDQPNAPQSASAIPNAPQPASEQANAPQPAGSPENPQGNPQGDPQAPGSVPKEVPQPAAQ